MPAEIIDVHRVTLMWRMWREIGQTLRQFDSEDDLGPKSHYEGPCKDQTVIIKQNQGPEAPESHRDCVRHCSVNPDLHTDVRTYSGLQRLFHGCRVPVHKEPRLRHWLELCSSCPECPGWPPLCSAPLKGSQPRGQLEGWQSSLWPWAERWEQGAEGDTERPTEEPSVFTKTMTQCLRWVGNATGISACCKSVWRVSKRSWHPLEKYHVDTTLCKNGMNKQLWLADQKWWGVCSSQALQTKTCRFRFFRQLHADKLV